MPRGDKLDTLAEDGAGQYRRCCRAIAGYIRRLACNLFHHLRAHVLELVFKLNFLRDGDTVLRDRGRSPRLFENDVAALGTQRNRHGIGQ